MAWYLIAALLLILLVVWYTRKLTLVGTLTAGLLAVFIYGGTGITGILLLGLFFLLGTAATRWKREQKVREGLVASDSTLRDAGQVLANGGVAALCGLCAWVSPHYEVLFLWMIAGAFSAAVADTLASELGMVYGRSFFNICTFKQDKKGLDGVISLEGTLLGVVGSMLTGGLYWLSDGVQIIVPVMVAGTLGNVVDSLLGATLERKGLLSNNGVNAVNTAAGAAAMAFFLLYTGIKKAAAERGCSNYSGKIYRGVFFCCGVLTGTSCGFL